MLERFSRGKAKFDKPVSIPSPGEYGAHTSVVAPCRNVLSVQGQVTSQEREWPGARLSEYVWFELKKLK